MTQRLPYRYTTARAILFLLFLLLAVWQTPANAQKKKKEKNSPDLLTSFPFKLLSGGIIIVEVRLDDFADTLNFILDTGSGGVSLDTSTVNSLGLPISPSDKMLRGIGSFRKISYVNNRTLHLPNLDVEHLNFHINNYELLTSVYGVKIDGIMGYSVLTRYVVKIDYDKSIVEIWNPGTVKYPKRGYLFYPAINGIPSFDAAVSDGSVSASRFYFDTGAGLCLLMSEDFEKDSAIIKKGKKITITQAEGLAGKNTMKLTTVRQLKIGPYKLKKVPAHIFKDEYNVTNYPYLGGLIGNDLLRRFNLIINYGEKEMHLTPNSHYSEPFDYSYTGLGIYLVNGKIVIEDVMKDSPGEIAGLQPGDVIIAVNNLLNGTIQTYKNLLQTVGSRLNLVILRDGALMTFRLKVKSIL